MDQTTTPGSSSSSSSKQERNTPVSLESDSTLSSYFSCYSSFASCGALQDTAEFPQKDASEDIMQRASISRRAEHLSSPPMRSRSQEGLRSRNNSAAGEVDEAVLALQRSQHDSDSEHVEASIRFLEIDGSGSSSQRRGHRRAMSDPFDAQEEQDDQAAAAATSAVLDDAAGPDSVSLQKRKTVLPTLPRYPVAAQRNKNCWSEPPVSIFHVRGPDYFDAAKKKKVPSAPYILAARGADLFLADTVIDYAKVSKYVSDRNIRSYRVDSDSDCAIELMPAHISPSLIFNFVRLWQERSHFGWQPSQASHTHGQLSLSVG